MNRPCGCGRPNVRYIKVGNINVGIVGLDEILFNVYILGIEDEVLIKKELVEMLKKKNYIPENMEDLYSEAFLREYKIFLKKQEVK